jgi:hypothetical protein
VDIAFSSLWRERKCNKIVAGKPEERNYLEYRRR